MTMIIIIILSRYHQTNGDERNNNKRYLRITRKLLETEHCNRNLIKGINTWAVPLVRYRRVFLK